MYPIRRRPPPPESDRRQPRTHRRVHRLGRGTTAVVLVLAVATLVGLVVLAFLRWDGTPASEPADRFSHMSAARSEATDQALGRIADIQGRRFDALTIDELEMVDPAKDGWDTETFSTAAARQLKLLGKILTQSTPIEPSQFASLAASGSSFTRLRPPTLIPVYEGPAVRVFRPKSDEPATDVPRMSGRAGLAQVLEWLRAPLLSGPDSTTSQRDHPARVETKVVRVELVEHSATTLVHYHGAGPQVGQRAQWNCKWTHEGPSSVPKLVSIELIKYEETARESDAVGRFVDCTESILGTNVCYREQTIPGLDHWRGRIDARLGVDLAGYHGLALADVNGDLLDDLYVCHGGGLPNQLFLQNPDGTATETASRAGVDYLDLTRSALLVDLDNDGDSDLVLAMGATVVLLANETSDGSVRFSPRTTVRTESQVYSLTAADYDRDGNLDIYACGYGSALGPVRNDNVLGMPMPYHDANNGGPSTLLRNDGAWSFRDVTRAAGIDQNNRRFSFAASWEDYDNDGDMDLYVANDFGRNNLYRNDGATFVDVAAPAGVEDISAGMSVSWADYDNDGWMDLYISNMFSSAGNRIAYQHQFKTLADGQVRSQFQRHARGNTLFRNSGDGTFRDLSVATDTTMGRWAWGSHFADINNDGLEDVLVVNGFFTGSDPDDL